MRLAIYARVSTPDQDVEPQLVRLRDWARSGGHDVAMERRDVASGRLVRRPGQEEIMQAARGHHVHAVAVAKVDRWARSIQHLAGTVNELHGLGVAFYAVDQGLSVKPKDATSALILNVLGSVAQWEGSIISERTRDTLAARQAAGVAIGRRPGTHRCPARPCLRLAGHPGRCAVKGIPIQQERAASENGGSLNDRLPAVPVSEVAPVSKVSSEKVNQ